MRQSGSVGKGAPEGASPCRASYVFQGMAEVMGFLAGRTASSPRPSPPSASAEAAADEEEERKMKLGGGVPGAALVPRLTRAIVFCPSGARGFCSLRSNMDEGLFRCDYLNAVFTVFVTHSGAGI